MLDDNPKLLAAQRQLRERRFSQFHSSALAPVAERSKGPRKPDANALRLIWPTLILSCDKALG